MKGMELSEWGYGKELGRIVKGEMSSQNILDKKLIKIKLNKKSYFHKFNLYPTTF